MYFLHKNNQVCDIFRRAKTHRNPSQPIAQNVGLIEERFPAATPAKPAALITYHHKITLTFLA